MRTTVESAPGLYPFPDLIRTWPTLQRMAEEQSRALRCIRELCTEERGHLSCAEGGIEECVASDGTVKLHLEEGARLRKDHIADPLEDVACVILEGSPYR